ncbi:MAG: TraB/GumN family protein [Proteobacteria bacterium]|nr:TraB/GumN family protein [Pseudomonadota bacterium]
MNASTLDVSATTDPLADQPHAIVERDGVRYTLLGTAHVSRASVEAVEALARDGRFDAIAVELDAQRLRNLTDPDALRNLDLFRILREGKTGLVAANLALSAYQRRLSEQLDVEPGAELKAAALAANERALPLQVIDRDVGITLRRAWRALGFWGRMKLMAGLGAGLFEREHVDAESIEKLKEGDMLESSFGEFAAQSPPIYNALIAERDRYMAALLRQANPPTHNEASSQQVRGEEGAPRPKVDSTLSPVRGEEGAPGPKVASARLEPRQILAVVGAGHLKGLAQHLREDITDPVSVRSELESVPTGSRVPWISIVIAVLVLGSFVWGYLHGGAQLGTRLIAIWFIATAVGGGLGCIAAGGHPLSVLAGALWSPFKPFHPGIASGTVSALVEAWARKPTYQDFMNLRDDVASLRGWYRNRVSRTFLNFFLTCLGTIGGEIYALARIAGKLG